MQENLTLIFWLCQPCPRPSICGALITSHPIPSQHPSPPPEIAPGDCYSICRHNLTIVHADLTSTVLNYASNPAFSHDSPPLSLSPEQSHIPASFQSVAHHRARFMPRCGATRSGAAAWCGWSSGGRALRVSARNRAAMRLSSSANRTVSGAMNVENAQSQVLSGRCPTGLEGKRGQGRRRCGVDPCAIGGEMGKQNRRWSHVYCL